MSLNRPTAAPGALRLAVTSGKGGVGKTSLTINLAVALARLGHRVSVVDADFGLGNIDVLLGLTPDAHLGAVLAGERTLDDIILDGPDGVRVVPAGSGVRALAALDERQWRVLAQVLDQLAQDSDFVLIDTATGVSANTLDVIALADYALVLTTYEPAAVVDAYATVKLISAASPKKPIGIVVNGSSDAAEAGLVFRQLSLAAERFLQRTLRYDGYIAQDPRVRDAILNQQPLVGQDISGPAGPCYRRLASRLASQRPAASGPWPSAETRAAMLAAATLTQQPPEAPRCA